MMEVLFRTILRMSFWGSVVALAVMGLSYLLRNKLSARFQYGIWILVIIRLILPLSFQSPVHFNNEVDRELGQFYYPVVEMQPMTADETNGQASNLTPAEIRSEDLLPLIWGGGVMLVLAYILSVNLMSISEIKKLTRNENAMVAELVMSSKRQLGITKEIDIYEGKQAMLCGILHPKIILGRTFLESLSSEELRYVILHELAHYKRKDLVVHLVTMMIQAVHWFNPIIHLAMIQVRRNCEMACDATVLSTLESGEDRDYGKTLISVMSLVSKPFWLPGTVGFASKKYFRRITMLTRYKNKHRGLAILVLIVVLFLTACTGLTDKGDTSKSQDSKPPVESQQPDSGEDKIEGSTTEAEEGEGVQTNVDSESAKRGSDLLNQIVNLAKEGKIIHFDYVADGSVNIYDIEDQWGEPQSSEWIPEAKGEYTTYPDKGIVFGSNKGGAIFEIRSFDTGLNDVTIDMALSKLGETPEHDVMLDSQRIIGYTMTDDYKLLLVFQKPANEKEAWVLDHYSVFYPRGTVNMMADDPGREW